MSYRSGSILYLVSVLYYLEKIVEENILGKCDLRLSVKSDVLHTVMPL